ncbi:hypothetical protein [Croceicoccus sp. Ery15]|uniref:hypothetical protein n=1 Tax=Croceicoccus sp. Ery15 TaxID=1703338 RepID=UPI001E28F4FF|nr:hypothetical protein [Croceicoccus sp. Ery15]
MLTIFIVLLFAAATALSWLTIRMLGRRIANSSGWYAVLRRYPDRGPDSGPDSGDKPLLVVKRASGRIGGVTIGRGLELHACRRGLRIYPMPWLRPMNTPALIPWRDIADSDETLRGHPMKRLGLGRPEIAVLTLDRPLWDELRGKAGH